MTHKFRQDGTLVAATICRAAPCFVVGLGAKDENGNLAVQLAAGRKKRINKPLSGQMGKAGVNFAPEIIREFRLSAKDKIPKLGGEIMVSKVISPGMFVDVIGVSKGRGFAGVIKRWGFHSQPATHGQRDRERSPGSIGAQTPGRVIKGKKMPGHLGNRRKTVLNLEILSVDNKKGEILIKGAVPGFKGGWLLVLVKRKLNDKEKS